MAFLSAALKRECPLTSFGTWRQPLLLHRGTVKDIRRLGLQSTFHWIQPWKVGCEQHPEKPWPQIPF